MEKLYIKLTIIICMDPPLAQVLDLNLLIKNNFGYYFFYNKN